MYRRRRLGERVRLVSPRFRALRHLSRPKLCEFLAILLVAGIVSTKGFADDVASGSLLASIIVSASQNPLQVAPTGEWVNGSPPSASGQIIGKVEGPVLDSEGKEFIQGWACVVGLSKSISVQVFRGGTATDSGVPLGFYAANAPSDAETSRLCEDSGVNHGFSIPVSSSLRIEHPGQRLYIYGVDPVSRSELLLLSDGGTHIYAATIFRPENYGTQSHAASASGKPQDSMQAIQAAITAAQAFIASHSGASAEVLLSAGDYVVSCHPGQKDLFCLSLDGSQNLVFGGAGLATRIVMQNPMAGGISALGAPQNVTLVGFAMDYEIPPFTQGTITEVDQEGLFVALDPGMPRLNRPEYLPSNAVAAFGMVFSPDASHPRLKRNTPNFFLTVPDPVHSNPGENRWRLADASAATDGFTTYAEVGDRYVQLARNGIGYGLYFFGGANITIDGVTIYAAPDVATLWGGNSGTVTINDLQILPSPNPVAPGVYRDISTDADGVHFSQNWARPTIKNSYFQGLADDGINIFSAGSTIAPTGSSDTMFSLSSYYEGLINVGDQLQFVIPSTGGIRGRAAVSDITPGSAGVEVTLSSAVPGLAATDVVFDLSADGANAVIKDNIFAASRERGIVCKSPGARISGNSFTDINVQGIALSSILVDGDYEGPNPTNVTISGNSFVGGDANQNGYGQIYIDTPESNYGNSKFRETSNITISNNSFTPSQSQGAPVPVYIYSAKNIYLDHDQVIDSSGNKTGLKLGSTVIVTNSVNVEIKN
jgi:hypothetical protein